MAERGGGGNEPRAKDVTKIEENVLEETESKEKTQETGAIAEVKSKIKEKNSEQTGEESVGGFKGLKIGATQSSLNKISKIGKHKRVKGKNDLLENQEGAEEEANAQIAKTDEIESESFESGAKDPTDTSLSKKSLMQIKSMVKGSKKTVNADEEKNEAFQTKPTDATDKSRKMTNESLSTFVISHDIESQKNQSLNRPSSIGQDTQDNLNRTPSQQQVPERGNYMNNVAPVPAEEPEDRESTNDGKKEEKSQN